MYIGAILSAITKFQNEATLSDAPNAQWRP